MQLAMIQETVVPFEQLEPAYLDRAMYFGDGVYEVIRSYQGCLFALDEHLERFNNSLMAVDIQGLNLQTIRNRVLEGYSVAHIANAKIYFHVTRGSEIRNLVNTSSPLPNFFMTVTELEEAEAEKIKGITVSTHPDWRWKRCDIKSLNLLANVLARRNAAAQGCDEAILVDEQGLLTEGSGSAFFAVFAGSRQEGAVLQTAPLSANILPSVTRRFVLDLANDLGIPVLERSIHQAQAHLAQEMFIAVTTKDIVPVVQFDGKTVQDGHPGKTTQALMKAFAGLITRRCSPTL